ncbi:unnamed protein product [Boreogadus saida]
MAGRRLGQGPALWGNTSVFALPSRRLGKRLRKKVESSPTQLIPVPPADPHQSTPADPQSPQLIPQSPQLIPQSPQLIPQSHPADPSPPS